MYPIPLYLLLLPFGLYMVWAQKMFASRKHLLKNSVNPSKTSSQLVSILIPFRNENGVIQKLVRQLAPDLRNHPNSELILIDDMSEDGGKEALKSEFSAEPQIHVVSSHGEGKKNALTTGIQKAKSEWIITLDADVNVSEDWLNLISGICQSAECDMLILPIQISNALNFYQKIEALEFMVLQSITFGYAQLERPFLCNGAHLAFRKSTFEELGGYEIHAHLSSGDDVFFLEQVMKSPIHRVGYSHFVELTVTTEPSQSLKAFLFQKIRWARKTSAFKSMEIFYITAVIAAVNLILVALAGLCLWKYFMIGLLVKSLADVMILRGSYDSTNKKLISFLPFFMLLYPFYFTFVSIATLFIKPNWKGRRVK